jgi:hypothetical protein
LYNSSVSGDRSTRETGIRPRQPLDIFWWLLAGALSWTATRIPDILYQNKQDVPQFLSRTALLLVGCIIGTFRPQRPWRWGLAAFLALALGDISHLGGDVHVPEMDLGHIWMHCTSGAADWAIHALPVLIGAYAAALLLKKGLR